MTTPNWWDFASTACVSVRVCRKRDRSLNESQLQQLSIGYLRLYVFGHFHHAWYFNLYALEIQYFHLKTEAKLLTIAFVCNQQVVIWNPVLSEQFDMHWQGWTEKDHIFSPENVGRLFSHYYISGKLEHIYPEKQQDNSDKDNGSKYMEGMV